MFSLLLGLVFIGCAASTPLLENLRIVGGRDVNITSVPYQVSLAHKGEYLCGGTIIYRDVILTAAHCLKDLKPENINVRVGSSYSHKGGQLYPAKDIIWHTSFTYKNMDNDVALILLDRPLQFNDKVAPIKLFNKNEQVKEGDITTVTGWGKLNEYGAIPKQLQLVKIPIVSPEKCTETYDMVYRITSTMICAGVPEGGLDACQGDSGGPLVYNGKVAGIVSWGIGCARPNLPGVYANVSALRSWIDEKIIYLRSKNVLRTV